MWSHNLQQLSYFPPLQLSKLCMCDRSNGKILIFQETDINQNNISSFPTNQMILMMLKKKTQSNKKPSKNALKETEVKNFTEKKKKKTKNNNFKRKSKGIEEIKINELDMYL